MPTQIWSIARNTFTESIRQPIFVVLLGAVALLQILATAWSAYTLDDDNKLLVDMGLGMMFLGGLFLAAFTAAGVLSREIENKTVLTVISKPIGRPAFILGKFIGVAAAVGVAFWVWSIVFLMCVRHGVMSTASDKLDMPVIVLGSAAAVLALAIAVWGNYFYGWVFTSRFAGTVAVTLTVAYALVLMISPKWEFQSLVHEFAEEEGHLTQVAIAMGLVFEALAIICAIAIASATRLGMVATLLICLGFFVLGLSSEYLFLRHTETQPAAWIGFAVAPNVQFLFLADALTQRSPISLNYVALVTGYSACYILAVLALATALFQTRETG